MYCNCAVYSVLIMFQFDLNTTKMFYEGQGYNCLKTNENNIQKKILSFFLIQSYYFEIRKYFIEVMILSVWFFETF